MAVLHTLSKKAVEWGVIERMPCAIRLLTHLIVLLGGRRGAVWRDRGRRGATCTRVRRRWSRRFGCWTLLASPSNVGEMLETGEGRGEGSSREGVGDGIDRRHVVQEWRHPTRERRGGRQAHQRATRRQQQHLPNEERAHRPRLRTERDDADQRDGERGLGQRPAVRIVGVRTSASGTLGLTA